MFLLYSISPSMYNWNSNQSMHVFWLSIQLSWPQAGTIEALFSHSLMFEHEVEGYARLTLFPVAHWQSNLRSSTPVPQAPKLPSSTSFPEHSLTFNQSWRSMNLALYNQSENWSWSLKLWRHRWNNLRSFQIIHRLLNKRISYMALACTHSVRLRIAS